MRRPLSSKLKRRDGSPSRTDGDRSPLAPIRPRLSIASASGSGSHDDRHHPHFQDSLAFLDDVMPLEINQPRAGPSVRNGNVSNHPLDQLEDDLGAWCARQGRSHLCVAACEQGVLTLCLGLPLQPLLFQDEPRIARLIATPLPPPSLIVDFENNLMSHLITAPDLDRLDSLDRPRLLNLYNRYRALPSSLTEDQRALIYAALCVARHYQMRAGPATAMFDPETPSREDVTYFHMAREAIDAWGRPSVDALCKSDPYVVDVGTRFGLMLIGNQGRYSACHLMPHRMEGCRI